MSYEQTFLESLRDVFVGARVEGKSGYINLMKIKARYFETGVFPRLMKDIDAACKPFSSGFREELFDKLYDFFRRYFSESGSIYFRHTAFHQNVYERVYTDERDVMLFWKTHMLYYVKTDRLFNSMSVDVDGVTFFIDVSGLEYKRSNEKRGLVYEFKRRDKDGRLVLTAEYATKGRKTQMEEILRAASEAGSSLDIETLERALGAFEKQSEVDYFINKNAKGFLQEQFDLWLYQYAFRGESDFTESRLRQLKAIREIAYRIIEFIAQFEDELVRVWNKPKFVLKSNYIATLDHIAGRNGALLKKLFRHKGMKDQIAEWRTLGMIDENFKLELVLEKDLVGEPLNRHYHFLPLDTRFFKDLEPAILGLFEDLDSSLDGWLIHSENYQAIATILPKWREGVDVIYIDPPYNTSASEIIYANDYKDASWLTLLENRLELAKLLLPQEGFLCVTIDDFELYRLRGLLSQVFGDDAILGTVAIKNNPAGRSTAKGFSIAHEYALFVTKSSDSQIGRLERTAKQIARYDERDSKGRFEWVNFRKHGGANALRGARRKLYYPIFVTDKGLRIPKMRWDGEKREWIELEKPRVKESILYPISPTGEERTWKWGHESVQDNMDDFTVRRDQQGKLAVYMKSRMKAEGTLPLTWWDKSLYSASDYGTNLLKNLFGEGQKFPFPKSVHATGDCIRVANPDDDIVVLDFFGGSGTTAHAVMNLNRADGGQRKYILVELDEYFHSVILPRVKKVAFSDKWKDGKAQEGQGMSHFVKYYELEQYEDALQKAEYRDAVDPPMFTGLDAYNSYVFLRDLKMLEAVRVNTTKNEVAVDLAGLYDGIDLAETLSCVSGKWIKRIAGDVVQFADGTSSSLSSPEWKDIKPLVWW